MIPMAILDSVLRRMVDAASLLLDSAERDAVCGDLTESEESGSRALREVLSLVVRRRAACLRGWRPWLTIVGLTVPLSVLVSLQSRRTADGTAIYLWLYVNNWDWTIIHNSGFWRDWPSALQAFSCHTSRSRAGHGRPACWSGASRDESSGLVALFSSW